ncbi:ribosome biosis protein nop16 [Diaporthe amygdali]|uniref:ribosome biosis protein nop16 n=1 Tax=Phomopsis amygdali TaxID=1214568 RepID=UPI0022FE3905|nr:ribosome biosis protein nop16 [Diaporthe amygdali]KAJ0117735.1 ribosome biosis protein nop16 [Diaporthe amygdali]
MGRDLQKRKNRSSRATIRQPNRLKKPLNPLGNSIIAKNWNKKETLSQNYRRLGLTAKLGKATGGVDPATKVSAPNGGAQDPLAVTPNSGAGAAFRSVKVERDADGKIVRVLRKDNPLNDPLNDLESESEDDDEQDDTAKNAAKKSSTSAGTTRVVDQLEAEASRPTEAHKRHQSQQEREWLARLLAKHGDNTAAMARDFKLNPMQQTEANISRKLRIYKANHQN